MGKTKNLVEEPQERDSTPQPTVLEKLPQTILLKGVHPEVFNAVNNYLGTRPHKEVSNLIKALEGSLDVNTQIIDDKKD